MSKPDIIYLILLAVFALGIAVFQYFYKAKRNSRKLFLFAFLRFLSLFLLGLLFLNPKFTQTIVTNVKPNLVVAIDNSNSIKLLNQDAKVAQFKSELNKSGLSKKFTIDYYTFGKLLQLQSDVTNFDEQQTNISRVFTSLKEIYSETQSPTLILTDGNQTFGQDYVTTSLNYNHPIYPIVLGDSVLKTDLKIKHIQHNKYAFLDNEFPVEITLDYLGKNTVNKEFMVFKNNKKVFSKTISFSEINNTQVVAFTLPAQGIGKQKYTAHLTPISNEKNTINNSRNFSVEVIDERTNILIISDIIHPDIGAFKKSIESNKQRKVSIAKPTDVIDLNNFQLLILYQPNNHFKGLFQQIELYNKNHLVITGLQTDWAFLNSIKSNYKRTVINQSQEYLGRYNTGFNLFQYNELEIESFPPLVSLYGDTQINSSADVLLYQNINSVVTKMPLLSFFEDASRREALLIGEGIWRWRAQSYINNKHFETFDSFIGKTVQYLASNTKKERLVIDVQDQYEIGEGKICAQYFDKNYVLDPNETLLCKLVNQKTKQIYTYSFLFKNNGYELDFSQLSVGEYTYHISVPKRGLSRKGKFEVLNFNIEAQFINPDIAKLSQLAANSETQLYFIDNYRQIFSMLENNKNYKTIQKSSTKQLPLIDWNYLLVILLLLLTFEWFLRKYNGLI